MDGFYLQFLTLLWLVTSAHCIIDGDGVFRSDFIGEAVAFIDNGVNTYLEHRFCTGTLITRREVLTVTKCCLHSTAETRVRLGSEQFRSFEDGQLFSLQSYRRVSGSDTNHANDNLWQLCVLQLTRPVPFDIVPLSLPMANEFLRNNEALHGYGYGSTRENVLKAHRSLRSMKMPILSNEECNNTYRKLLQHDNGRNLSLYMCIGHTHKKIKMVEFDAGGPIVDIDRRRLRGVSLSHMPSERSQGDNYPTFAAKVELFRNEIDAVIKHMNSNNN